MNAIEVKNPELPRSASVSNNREGMIRELQELRDTLEELYEKNTQLDEENLTLRKEVKDMKGQIGNVLETMRVLREDLKKAHDILSKPRVTSNMNLPI